MKNYKIAILIACIAWYSMAVWADEQELVTEVAVQTGKITKTTLHRYVMAYGTVEPESARDGKPAASSKIAAPMMGILTQIHCEEGQQFKKGDLLFELDTRNADALIAKAEVAVEFAKKNFARKQQLNATDNISRKLYDEAEQLLQTARKDLLNAKTQKDLLQIKAPLSGTVAAIHFKVGEAVSLNAILADLIDLDRLDIAIHVPSQEAASLRLGQSVEISTGSAASSVTIQPGKLIFIGAQIDPLTDTVLVRASLQNGSGLRPGQFVNVRIVTEERSGRLAVPVESVVTRAGASVIAVVEGDRAKQKVIQPSLRDGNLIEISGEGLQEGMTIVTQGVYGLPPETRIRVVK
ncbi:efflux RND transporter periplasmic adaptor subunit [Methylobacter sp.]|uniref:efflux RND transporter periplasmic adaptor subunit n=1 Tax=Methylobacter sp. TaxID=2051955 RepID=UPI00121E3AC0|nr:efflux RND transporter periplasmic adaptor subunit [Methylobacter sp.]TAK61951.1 MAG: efflux RND transporter periplasmic adaptor subunit [Methylobacter sp.]